jgi:hypothetical protein
MRPPSGVGIGSFGAGREHLQVTLQALLAQHVELVAMLVSGLERLEGALAIAGSQRLFARFEHLRRIARQRRRFRGVRQRQGGELRNLRQLHGGARFRGGGGLHKFPSPGVAVAGSGEVAGTPQLGPQLQRAEQRETRRTIFVRRELRIGNVQSARLAGKDLSFGDLSRGQQGPSIAEQGQRLGFRIARGHRLRGDGQARRRLAALLDAAEDVLRRQPVAAELRIELSRFVRGAGGRVEIIPRQQRVGLLHQELRVGGAPVGAAVERFRRAAVSWYSAIESTTACGESPGPSYGTFNS